MAYLVLLIECLVEIQSVKELPVTSTPVRLTDSRVEDGQSPVLMISAIHFQEKAPAAPAAATKPLVHIVALV
jgi:hypothetical protein